jgi:hypothetical protein
MRSHRVLLGNRGEAADILYGDLAGILTRAGKKDRPLDQKDQSVQQG